jgi:hypothetical protein
MVLRRRDPTLERERGGAQKQQRRGVQGDSRSVRAIEDNHRIGIIRDRARRAEDAAPSLEDEIVSAPSRVWDGERSGCDAHPPIDDWRVGEYCRTVGRRRRPLLAAIGRGRYGVARAGLASKTTRRSRASRST